jgi:hypothetical protein
MNLGSASQADSNNQRHAWLEENHEFKGRSRRKIERWRKLIFRLL